MLLRNGKSYEYNPNPSNKKKFSNLKYTQYRNNLFHYINYNVLSNLLKILAFVSIVPVFYISSMYLYEYVVQFNNNSFKNINDIISEYNRNGHSVGLHGERCVFIYDNFTYVKPIRCSMNNDNTGLYGFVQRYYHNISTIFHNWYTLLYDNVYLFIQSFEQ